MAFRAERVSSLTSAMESSEKANLIDPLKFPSLNFREVALCKYLAGSWGAFLTSVDPFWADGRRDSLSAMFVYQESHRLPLTAATWCMKAPSGKQQKPFPNLNGVRTGYLFKIFAQLRVSCLSGAFGYSPQELTPLT